MSENTNDSANPVLTFEGKKYLINELSNDDKKEIKLSFKPKQPKEWQKNPNTWLTTDEINEVMKQYEKTYENFEFLGPSPIDYDTHKAYGECVWEELCEFNLRDNLKEGKTKVGIIFNTDPHNKSGTHWIALFIDIKNSFIAYFDSNGNKVPKEIIIFIIFNIT